MLKEQFYKNLKISKFTRIFMENQINCDWVARVAFPIQIFLIFNGCRNRYFWDVWLKINRQPTLNNFCALSVPVHSIFPKQTVFMSTKS